MLKCSNLSFSFTKGPEINYPDIQLNEDDVLLFKGESGSGKTTLFNLINGLLPIQKGIIQVENLKHEKGSSRIYQKGVIDKIGLLFQRNYFVSSLNMMQNCQIHPNAKTQIIKKLMDLLDVSKHQNKYPSELSDGELQRMSLVRALSHSPKLLMADEPTSSLDKVNTKRFSELILKLKEELGLSVFIITHDDRLDTFFSNQMWLK